MKITDKIKFKKIASGQYISEFTFDNITYKLEAEKSDYHTGWDWNFSVNGQRITGDSSNLLRLADLKKGSYQYWIENYSE